MPANVHVMDTYELIPSVGLSKQVSRLGLGYSNTMLGTHLEGIYNRMGHQVSVLSVCRSRFVAEGTYTRRGI
jgi:hypothetical protein